MVVLDVKKRLLGRELRGLDPQRSPEHAADARSTSRVDAQARGAGEIVVNSIENDGRMKGYDLALAIRLRQALHVPMTVLGGAGSLADMGKLIERLRRGRRRGRQPVRVQGCLQGGADQLSRTRRRRTTSSGLRSSGSPDACSQRLPQFTRLPGKQECSLTEPS